MVDRLLELSPGARDLIDPSVSEPEITPVAPEGLTSFPVPEVLRPAPEIEPLGKPYSS